MIGLTLLFHIFAGIAFVVAGFWLVRQKVRLDWSARFWKVLSSRAKKAFIIDWPYHFLTRLCDTLGLECDGVARKHRARPVKIMLFPWLDLHQGFGIQHLSWKDHEKVLVVHLRRDIQESMYEPWRERLEASLGRQLEVKLQCEKDG